ncbi:hypothetical protein AJ79_06404 [Helicocarpus griseus UAMH5409]|uniref:Uncharacterized protein n=1 Tax=Helicocarpus griseus UAMH5409 TaxID=1447875 RepID=A0A2B7XDT7_9EURO|nr:hypothetical protein AJ79_06404 [Helicocarpus griseus UAMH5409]
MSYLHPTHASHARSHKSDFKRTVMKISDAVNKSRITDKKYTEALVLSARWTNDDLNLGQMENDLLKAFSASYNFTTEKLLIQHTHYSVVSNTTIRLAQDLIKMDRETNLLVFVYEIVRTLDNEELILFSCSCCCVTEIEEHRILVAGGFNSPNAANITTNFTSRFIQNINKFADTEITVAQLHAELVAEAGSQKAYLDNAPIHIAPGSKPSITLRKLSEMPREVQQLKRTCDSKVLVSVNLQGKHTIPDLEQWKRWLSETIPSNVAKTKLQALFGSSSTYCLLTMPVEVWDMLEDHDAYAFVQFVNTDNQLLLPATSEQPTPCCSTVSSPPQRQMFFGLERPFSANLPRRPRADTEQK